MPSRKVDYSNLNLSTIDIMNVIRENAPFEYQSQIPKVTTTNDIPKVGEYIVGNFAHTNYFLSELMNRIAYVKLTSAIFNNPYERLKKGFIEYGESIEHIFVNIIKAKKFDAEKAEEREFKRSMPDVKTFFTAINWRVMYPVTIQDEDLRQAFLSADGVTDLIAKIVDSVYTSASYDEFLLFKYLMIKAVANGSIKNKIMLTGDATIENLATQFRSTTNKFTFMSSDFNEANVATTCPRDKQVLFMDSDFDARFDVENLANAFNMDKATYLASRYLMDDWGTFDNDRFKDIQAESDILEEVTAEELEKMKKVKGILCSEDWFCVYDNLARFTETYVSSGLYWNYFYHTWKTITHNPFENAVVFIADDTVPEAPATLNFEVAEIGKTKKYGKGTKETIKIILTPTDDLTESYKFVTNEDNVTAGIAVEPYGVIIMPTNVADESPKTTITVEYMGEGYQAEISTKGITTGTAVSLTKL